MTNKKNVLKIYLPTRCFLERSGLLIGCEDAAGTYCCVTGTISSVREAQKLENRKLPDGYTVGIVGVWENHTYPAPKLTRENGLSVPRIAFPFKQKRMIFVKLYPFAQLSASWIESESGSFDSKTQDSLVIVLVDFERIIKSSFLLQKCTDSQVSTERSGSTMQRTSNIDILALSIEQFLSYAKDLESDVVNHVVDLTRACRSCWWSYVVAECQRFIVYVTCLMLRAASYVGKNR